MTNLHKDMQNIYNENQNQNRKSIPKEKIKVLNN